MNAFVEFLRLIGMGMFSLCLVGIAYIFIVIIRLALFSGEKIEDDENEDLFEVSEDRKNGNANKTTSGNSIRKR